MAGHTEIELKWAVDPDGYARLSHHLAQLLGPPLCLAQENRFFDTPTMSLRRQGLGLRLRLEDHEGVLRLLLTCKRRLPSQHGAHHHDEWERWLDAALWQTIGEPDLAARIPLPEHVLVACGGDRLIALGGFANLRLEFRLPPDLICLDRTDFTVRTDHELEIETPDPERSGRQWRERLSQWQVPWSEQPLTKFARYLALSPAVATPPAEPTSG